MKGWYGDKYSHSLASKGIKSKSSIILNQQPYIKKIIFSFWKSSRENNFDNFDFNTFFNVAKDNLYNQVSGQINWSPKEVVECFENMAKDLNVDINEMENAPCDLMWRDYRLSKLFIKIENIPDRLLDKILLVDEIIHEEHANGSIWTIYNYETDEDESIDINELRKEFDEWYTGVRMFR